MLPLPGDVIVTHDKGIWPWIIRLGPHIHNALFRDRQPALWNHVAVIMPPDAAGNPWCIEGRPGGVGWQDPRPYLAGRYTLTNAGQPKTDEQRRQICTVMEALAASRVPYDWPAIVIDTFREFSPLWDADGAWGNAVPAHVVCSSAADYVYERVGLGSPTPDRYCTPWDWAQYIERAQW